MWRGNKNIDVIVEEGAVIEINSWALWKARLGKKEPVEGEDYHA